MIRGMIPPSRRTIRPCRGSPGSRRATPSGSFRAVVYAGTDPLTRHYTASQLLAASFDLRKTAARLGHSGGGATTLRHYADPVPQVDRRAAAYLSQLTPPPPPPLPAASP